MGPSETKASQKGLAFLSSKDPEMVVNDIFDCDDTNIDAGLLNKILTDILDILAPIRTI